MGRRSVTALDLLYESSQERTKWIVSLLSKGKAIRFAILLVWLCYWRWFSKASHSETDNRAIILMLDLKAKQKLRDKQSGHIRLVDGSLTVLCKLDRQQICYIRNFDREGYTPGVQKNSFWCGGQSGAPQKWPDPIWVNYINYDKIRKIKFRSGL